MIKDSGISMDKLGTYLIEQLDEMLGGKANKVGLGMFAQVSIRNFVKYGVVWNGVVEKVTMSPADNNEGYILSTTRSIDVATDSQRCFGHNECSFQCYVRSIDGCNIETEAVHMT